MTEIIIAVVGSGAFFTFLQFLISRKDSNNSIIKDMKDAIDVLTTKVGEIENKLEERKAATARIQILRFADELADGKEFAKGHYEDIYEAINIYNAYCETHPKFKNEQTVDAQEIIRKRYKEHTENHSFKKY